MRHRELFTYRPGKEPMEAFGKDSGSITMSFWDFFQMTVMTMDWIHIAHCQALKALYIEPIIHSHHSGTLLGTVLLHAELLPTRRLCFFAWTPFFQEVSSVLSIYWGVQGLFSTPE